MAFSRITITFNEDLVIDDVVTLTTSPLSILTYKWVINRNQNNQVTVGTPTATLGETAAINFTAAFSLDEDLNVYDISQTSNVVTIVIQNETQTFISGVSNANVTFVIDSVVTPPEDIKYDRIQVRSPYFITAPIDTGSTEIVPDKAVFEVFIWSGDVAADKPTTPTYTFEKQQRFSGDQILYIDIAEQTQDFINHNYDGTFGFSCVFVSYRVTTTYSEGTLVKNDTLLAFDGYNIQSEGVNYSPINDLMISNRYISVKKGETINLPFYLGGDNYTVEFRIGNVVESTESVNFTNILNTSGAVTLISDTANEINNIRVVNNTTLEEFIIDVEIIEECIYDPIKTVFINRYGVQQDFWFFKANKKNQVITSESYKRKVLEENIVDSVPVLSYNTTSHQTVKYNVTGSTSITLNSGYIDEDNNEVIKQMLLSEYVWANENSVVIPLDLQDKSLSYLTKRNDQLIKYTLRFNYSYDDVQNIR